MLSSDPFTPGSRLWGSWYAPQSPAARAAPEYWAQGRIPAACPGWTAGAATQHVSRSFHSLSQWPPVFRGRGESWAWGCSWGPPQGLSCGSWRKGRIWSGPCGWHRCVPMAAWDMVTSGPEVPRATHTSLGPLDGAPARDSDVPSSAQCPEPHSPRPTCTPPERPHNRLLAA